MKYIPSQMILISGYLQHRLMVHSVGTHMIETVEKSLLTWMTLNPEDLFDLSPPHPNAWTAAVIFG